MFTIVGVEVLALIGLLIILNRLGAKVHDHLNYLNSSKYNLKGKKWSFSTCNAQFLMCENTFSTAI